MGYDKTNKDLVKVNNEYFSGSQASIFIGDIWVDDICEWQYQVNYGATPIYGYGSQLFDHVAEGRQLVQGSFTINFKEPNYLWAILQHTQYGKKKLSLTKQEVNVSTYQSPWTNASEATFIADKRQKLETLFNTKNPKKVSNAILQSNKINKIQNTNTQEIDFKKPTFDILLGYGAQLDSNSPGERIIEVKLVGKSKIIMSDGNPIREQYNFFAKNVI